MNHDIEAIFLDVGNTLRIVLEESDFQQQAMQELMALVGATEPQDEFFEKVEARWKKYRSACKVSLLESSEEVLWTKHLLPDYPAEKIAPLHGRLTRLWRDRDGRRVPRADAKETIIEQTLKKRSSSCIDAVIYWASLPTPSLKLRFQIGWKLTTSRNTLKP